jgi:TRAP-type C4-dicarboxylate transport system permease small subunit
LLVAHLPKNLAVSAEILLDFVGCVICVVLFYYGLQGSIEAYVDKSIPDKLLKIDNWWMVSIFSASFFMLAIEFLLRMRRARTVLEKEKTISTEAGF